MAWDRGPTYHPVNDTNNMQLKWSRWGRYCRFRRWL